MQQIFTAYLHAVRHVAPQHSSVVTVSETDTET